MGRQKTRLRLPAILIAGALLCAAAPGLQGQQPTATPLPEAPQSAQTVSGTITDLDGDVIVGAQAMLSDSAQTTVSDGNGRFILAVPVPGEIRLTLSAPGFATSVQLLTLHPGQQLDLAQIQLSVALTTDVEVVLSRHDVAQIEMHEEEKQRILGVLPNFFVVYDWNAPPLSTKQKFELSLRSTLDPTSFVISGAIAGVQQANNDFSGYGQGAQGYGKRYGAAMADEAIGNMLGGAILPSLLHQDPRYFYKGTGTIRHRALYAIAASVICKGDNGHWQPNYSSVVGNFGSGAISNLYYPATDRNGAGLTIQNGFLGILGDAVGNVIQEFAFRHLTTNTKHNPPASISAPPTTSSPTTTSP